MLFSTHVTFGSPALCCWALELIAPLDYYISIDLLKSTAWSQALLRPDTNGRRWGRHSVRLVLLIWVFSKCYCIVIIVLSQMCQTLSGFSHICIQWERQSVCCDYTISHGMRPLPGLCVCIKTLGLANIFSNGLDYILVFRPSVLRVIYEYCFLIC